MSSSEKKISDPQIDLDLFFELSPDLMCIAGFDGYFKKVNSSFINMIGYTWAELKARPINEYIHPEDRILTSQFRNEIKKGVPLINFENRYITKSGEVVWLAWTSMPYERSELVYAIAKNVTHKKKLEQDRNIILSHLTHINKEIKQLGYRTSHDLRSPVNNLLSAFSLIDHSKIEDIETLEFLELIKISVEGLKKSLNHYTDVLTEKTESQISVEELQFKDAFNVVVKSLKSLIKDTQCTIDFNFDLAPTIRFNKYYLESIFLNLISNSIKYSKAFQAPEIKIRTRKFDGYTELIFSDKGLGFDVEKTKNKIFGLHQKFHSHEDSKGIGLYLIYNYLINLHGKISVESQVNKGSTFTLSFVD
ncbi:PAS domain-containing sensor histidine kinase [Peijinzhouia sedimentorum]